MKQKQKQWRTLLQFLTYKNRKYIFITVPSPRQIMSVSERLSVRARLTWVPELWLNAHCARWQVSANLATDELCRTASKSLGYVIAETAHPRRCQWRYHSAGYADSRGALPAGFSSLPNCVPVAVREWWWCHGQCKMTMVISYIAYNVCGPLRQLWQHRQHRNRFGPIVCNA